MQCDESRSPWIRGELARWQQLIEGKTPERVAKNTLLYSQGQTADRVYIVAKGRVRVTSFAGGGGEKQLYIAEEGSIIGEESCILHEGYSASAVTIVDCLLYPVSAVDLVRTMWHSDNITEMVLKLLCRKNVALQNQVLQLSFSQALPRIAQTLLDLGREYGESLPNGRRISIRFTHQDVANLLGVSRVTVSNAFRHLEDKKLIRRHSGRFLIIDESGLLELVGKNAHIQENEKTKIEK